MSSVSSLPDEGDEIHGPGLPKPIRLSEVAQIAAERLDGVADGSLKEALALRPADPPITPEPEVTDRVETGSSGSSADPPAPLAETQPDVASAEPQPIAGPEPSQAMWPPPPAVTAEASPANPESAGSPDVSQATGDAAEAPSAGPPSLATETTEVGRPFASAPADAQPSDIALDAKDPGTDALPEAPSPPTPPYVAPMLFRAEPIQAMRPVARAHGAVHPLQLAPDVAGGRNEPSLAALPTIAPTSADSDTIGAAPPLASAYGAAAKLAADATAAAEAIENLKRLLERQLPSPAQAPQQPVHELFAEPATAHAPPPLPAQEPPPEMQDYEPDPAPDEPLPRQGARNPAWRERRQFDFRGFMAGFALSWAIGAVLYIYLMAG